MWITYRTKSLLAKGLRFFEPSIAGIPDAPKGSS